MGGPIPGLGGSPQWQKQIQTLGSLSQEHREEGAREPRHSASVPAVTQEPTLPRPLNGHHFSPPYLETSSHNAPDRKLAPLPRKRKSAGGTYPAKVTREAPARYDL